MRDEEAAQEGYAGMNIYKYGKNLRCGYTTGACAAAAARAAADMLLNDRVAADTELVLKGSAVRFSVEDATRGDGWARCAVRKDAGADIDVTDGLLIYAEVQRTVAGSRAGAAALDPQNADPPENGASRVGRADPPEQEISRVGRTAPTKERIIIKGGPGVGTVTKAGLDQPVGAAAINSGPRRMITDAVLQICDEADYDGALTVTVSVPGGAEIAEKTFNPVLGIQGGISILGSTGIVEPMSEPALIETIRAEMRVKWLEISAYNDAADGVNSTNDAADMYGDGAAETVQGAGERRVKRDTVVIVPGNYGMKFAAEKLGAAEDRTVKCSNFIGEALDCACELGISEIVLAGNLGKLVKLAGGIFNTHSRNADCRMDILMRCAFTAASELISGSQNDDSACSDNRYRYDRKNSAEAVCSLMAALNSCVTTDAAVEVLKEAGTAITGGDACSYGNIDCSENINVEKHSLLDATMRIIAEKAIYHIKRRCSGSENGIPRIRFIIISNDMEILAEDVIK